MMNNHKPRCQKLHEIQIIAFLLYLRIQIKTLSSLCIHIDPCSPIIVPYS